MEERCYGGRSNPVVAGIDGSRSAVEAARWAAADACRRGLSLRLVHAYESAGRDYPALEVTAAEVREAMRETGIRRLEAAGKSAAEAVPGLDITTEVVEGDPRVVLVEESRRAALLVLGSRGLGSAGKFLLGSTGLALAAHGRCPLVIVRDGDTRPGPILVGVDGWPASAAAVRFAFQEAAELGTSVTALRTWSELGPIRPGVRRFDGSGVLHDAERRALAVEVSSVAREYPDVPFGCLVVRGRAGTALREYGERAGLIVVGTRGRGALAGLLSGSVSRSLAGRAPCPVAVVRAGTGLRNPHSKEGNRT
ncbi:universal stress protein [Amycolatopsis decaplanina]|uniref:Universal stress protein UspA-like protein n=1 Tax=Amycolatopsis decaplanina DSM 44594 TaxID=1284240 RepID=M2Z2F9_9PSEU|nr:universal stress protein [Amycolatopsis decaplanina]EME55053.1 universal stress protein UspA-like protein [Amycolatopsis decaplanina DSM 44594]